MGCASSSTIIKLPETRHLTPVEVDMCTPAITMLRLRDRFWDSPSDEDFVVRDVEKNQDFFRVNCSKSTMKTLRDSRDRPLMHIRRELMAAVPTYNVFDAKGLAAKLFSIKAQSELNVEFLDPSTGEKCRIGLTGSWTNRQASIWMEQSHKGSRTLVGRVFRPSGSRSSVNTMRSSVSRSLHDDEYFLTVAKGVDMSLMVLICMAQEMVSDEESIDGM
jgi:uncharacterized protein YxjI